MKRIVMRVVAALAVALVPAAAMADDITLSGDPITMDRLVDHTEVIRVVDAIDAAVDAKAWDVARSHFTEMVDVDFTGLIGGEPATIPADGLIGGWSTNLTANKPSFHLRGNHRVTFTGTDTAVVLSHGYAWNMMEEGAMPENGGDPLWEVWGGYEHGLVRTDGVWRVRTMSFFPWAERGNPFVRNTPGT